MSVGLSRPWAAIGALAILGACATAPEPLPLRADAYPGELVAPERLVSPPALGAEFAYQHRVRSVTAQGEWEFSAVLQKRGNELLLVGFGPHGGRAFVLRQVGTQVDFESHLPRELPFPPRFMMIDVQRTWFWGAELWNEGEPPSGERRRVRQGEEVVEVWRDGRLRECIFRRLDDRPEGVIRVQYEGGLGPERPPSRVTLDNGWFGYRLELTTLTHQRLSGAEPEPT